MSTIAINDLNVVSTLSDLEVKSVVGGFFNFTKVVTITSITQEAANVALFAGRQTINQIAVIA